MRSPTLVLRGGVRELRSPVDRKNLSRREGLRGVAMRDPIILLRSVSESYTLRCVVTDGLCCCEE
jgi:hypothetical protein